MSTVGTKNYNGQDWFWPHDYRHYLRDANARQRKLVHNGWLKIGVPVKKSGLKISDRYLEPKKSQEKKAWTIVKKVIAPKELESVNEEAYYDSDNKIKTSIDNCFKKAGIKVVKFKPMKTSFHRGLWGGFYHIKSARGTDTIPVYVDKKGFIELGVSAEGFRIGKVGSSQVVKNLKDFKKSDIDESVNEGLNSKGFSIINQSIKTMAINFRDLQKLVKKQDDSRMWNEVDNIRYDLNRIEKVLKNKTYNESVNEGMTKYNIRLTKTPGWYGIWDKNGKQKAEGEKKYIIKFLKSLKTRMGNFQIKSLVDLAADRKGTNIAFDVAESINEGFADKLTKKMKKHKGTSVKSKKKVKLKGRGVYQQYESDLPITTKKGKTVRAVHKKSGKEIVSVDNPSTRKILKKMGFVVKEGIFSSWMVDKAVKIDPSFGDAWSLRGLHANFLSRSGIQSNKYIKIANESHNKAIELSPNSLATINRSEGYFAENGNVEKSTEMLLNGMKMSGGSVARINSSLGYILL